MEQPFEAYIDKLTLITVLFPNSNNRDEWIEFALINEKEEQIVMAKKVNETNTMEKYEIVVETPLNLKETYEIKDRSGNREKLMVGAVIRTNEFDAAYAYEENDLGCHYTKDWSSFKVWAPTASLVKLNLYYEQNEKTDSLNMQRNNNGVWSIKIDGDLEKVMYTYSVCVNRVWREAVDPYVKSVSINGEYGVIVDLDKTRQFENKLKNRPNFEHTMDAIIYELHIRDFTIHPNSGIKHKGKYTGMVESDTKTKNGANSGLTYLKQLGITHLELLPIQDFEGVDEKSPHLHYNWGYNPIHYFAPEGSYALHPDDPYSRLKELKEMIATFHENGLRVIMDVVFNHVYERETSSLEKIVPGYYFRHDENGMPSNGTGVGNDTASERKMMKKLIVDCIRYWAEEFAVDGFRFDLMGIHDYGTMNAVREELDEIDSTIIVLGEGWNLNTPLPDPEKASIENAYKMPGISHFNDQFRDVMKGSTFNLHDLGFLGGNTSGLEMTKNLVAGSVIKNDRGIFNQPFQSINYIESHDNHTLWDKLCVSNPHDNERIRQQRHILGSSIVLLSQGIPFIHSGQEFFRTKNGIGNSYCSPDRINQLDWNEKDKQQNTVTFIKNLIKLRKEHPAFRLRTADAINQHLNMITCEHPILAYQIENVGTIDSWNHVIVFHNSLDEDVAVNLNLEGEWFAAVKGMKVYHDKEEGISLTNDIIVEAISTLVLFQT